MHALLDNVNLLSLSERLDWINRMPLETNRPSGGVLGLYSSIKHDFSAPQAKKNEVFSYLRSWTPPWGGGGWVAKLED